jgi:drug/metabolite transporter (DMT)-like permease
VTFLYTSLALVAFAANSLLCRLALGGRSIDPASFTTIRLVSGAAMLAAIAVIRVYGDPKRVALQQTGVGRPFQGRQVETDVGRPLQGPHIETDVGRPLQGPHIETDVGRPLQGPHVETDVGRPFQGRQAAQALQSRGAGWRSAAALFAYAITFSLAYVTLPVATGALILFGAVQTTMLVAAIRGGERPRPAEWGGLVMAVAGLIYLVSPGLTAPSTLGSVLMVVSGVAWGWYSLLGRRGVDPIGDTTMNFIRTVPMTLVASVAAIAVMHVTMRGAQHAAISGGITSGLGYVAWYAALPRLTATRAATVQLATPLMTAAGGVMFLSEQVSARLGMSAGLILGGIAIAVFSRLRKR